MRKIVPNHLHRLFYSMLRIRRTEEAIASEYSGQEMRCPIHLCIGEEAVAAGVCANLGDEDIVMSMHRSHGHYLAKGGSLKRLIAELYGKATGAACGYGGSQHLIDQSVHFLGATPIVASTIPVAVGTAWALQMQHAKWKMENGEKNRKKSQRPKASDQRPISVVFFGEAAVEEGVVHESFNFAVLKQLPVFFVCENNQYSVNTPMRYRQPHGSVYQLAGAHGISASQMDGNDVVGVHRKAGEIIATMRAGGGPVFLECHTYRFLEHCGPYSDTGIVRPEEEVRPWQKKDPIERMKKYMKAKKMIHAAGIEEMEEKIQREIHDAFRFAKDSPLPTERLSEEMVYAKQ